MTKLRGLSIAVVVLLVLNIATLTVHFLHGPMHGWRGKPEGPKKIIIERLKFDDTQVAAYEKLITEHRKHIDELDKRMMDLRGELYTSTDTHIVDSLITLVGTTQAEVERVHTGHFADIRALCRPDQQTLFSELTKDLAGYFRNGPPPPREGR